MTPLPLGLTRNEHFGGRQRVRRCLSSKAGLGSEPEGHNCIRKKQATGHVSALTPPILYFFRRRTRGEKAARQAVQRILRGFTVVPLTGEMVETAYTASLPDFEDVLQFEAAKAANVDVIVTRNKKHFRQKEVRVLNPEEFVEQMEPTQKP